MTMTERLEAHMLDHSMKGMVDIVMAELEVGDIDQLSREHPDLAAELVDQFDSMVNEDEFFG